MRPRPAQPKSRDYFLKALILGSCKGGAHINHKHRSNALACRNRKKETMPAAVLPHVSDNYNVAFDWERDTDLFRVYADVNDYIDSDRHDVYIETIHLLDDALQPAAVINTAMFTPEEWADIKAAAVREYERQYE